MGATGTQHTLTKVGDDIVFRARRISTAELDALLPIFGDIKTVSIDIGAGATLIGESVYLISTAEDRSFAEIVTKSRGPGL